MVRLPIILIVGILLHAGIASAVTNLCVQIKSDADNQEGFKKLVHSELGRHKSHRVVNEDCQSTMSVALFAVEGMRYLTVRIDREIPVRHVIRKKEDLAAKLSLAMTLVLGNDPAYLTEDISHYSLVQRASNSVFKQGINIWRFEIFQAMGRGGSNLVFAPGGAFAITRGSGNWQVLARIYFAGWPGSIGQTDVALRIFTGADAGITYELSPISNTSFYLSGGLGLQFLRYEGHVVNGNSTSLEHVNQVMPAAFARLGIRFLRLYDFDCDIYASGHLPFFNTNETDSLLFGDDGLYTPSVQLGFGVGF